MEELGQKYAQLIIQASEELYTDIMQLYTDMGAYGKASYYWELKARYTEKRHVAELPVIQRDTGEKTDQALPGVNIQDYMELFVGREDIYAREITGEGNRRVTEQIMEPLTDEQVRRHLAGDEILESYVRRPNNTSKYVVFDIDISKRSCSSIIMGLRNLPHISRKPQNVHHRYA